MSNRNKYSLHGGDDACYGPAFGPVIAEEIDEVADSYNTRYILLSLSVQFDYNGDLIEFLLVTPRYKGDTLDTIREEGCIVNVWKVFPGKRQQLINGISQDKAKFWSVGNCNPIKD